MGQIRRLRFEEITLALRGAISGRSIPVGSLLPTEKALQEEFNVSRTTVRRALAELIRLGWAEAVPNRGVVAKIGPSNGGSKQIAYIDDKNWVHLALFFELSRILASNGYHLVQVDSCEIGTQGAMEWAADQGFAAALVWPKTAFPDPEAVARIQAQMPVIAIDHGLDLCDTDLVMTDHMAGARDIVRHLIDLGRKRIAISGYMSHLDDFHLRFSGYMCAHFENKLMPEAHDFVFSSPNQRDVEDTRLLRFRLNQPDRPDAVFVCHDMSVPAVVSAILGEGLRVPEDVAVVGFGNDLPFAIGNVGLTTISMNWHQVAEKLVERLFYRLAHPSSRYAKVVLPGKLVIRGSCGAPQERWSNAPYEPSSVTVTKRLPSPTPRQQAGPAGSTDLDSPTHASQIRNPSPQV
ncbi:MAG: GntR family transcriptional regulator [Fimbriimonas sp.]